jgi:hypothetical protein
MKISKLKYHPKNPRRISDEALEKLMQSIRDFPKMMELRPIIYDPATFEVLGGNQRLAALQKLGYTEIPDAWVRSADTLTDAEKRKFQILDNSPAGLSGEWDNEMLISDWNDLPLEDWGLIKGNLNNEQLPEIFDNYLSDEKIEIYFSLTKKFYETTHKEIRDKLSKEINIGLMSNDKVNYIIYQLAIYDWLLLNAKPGKKKINKYSFIVPLNIEMINIILNRYKNIDNLISGFKAYINEL